METANKLVTPVSPVIVVDLDGIYIDHVIRCPNCHGNGVIVHREIDSDVISDAVDCRKCDGYGFVVFDVEVF